MQQGLSNKEACRIVGINDKTGRRWRNGRSADRRQKAAPPIHLVVPPPGPSRYLREDDRVSLGWCDAACDLPLRYNGERPGVYAVAVATDQGEVVIRRTAVTQPE